MEVTFFFSKHKLKTEFYLAMHLWHKQFMLQTFCRDKKADPCSM